MCSECGQMFLTTGTLKKHLKTQHFDPQIYQKIFKRKDKSNNKLSIHSGIRPFLCDLCSKKFITKTKLKEYQRRHLGEKRFFCLLCSKLKISRLEKTFGKNSSKSGQKYFAKCATYTTNYIESKSASINCQRIYFFLFIIWFISCNTQS